MANLLEYFANEPKNDLTIKSLVLPSDVHHISQPSRCRLNRAGRLAERAITLTGIFLAVSSPLGWLTTAGVAIGAKAAGLIIGKGVDVAVDESHYRKTWPGSKKRKWSDFIPV